MRLIDADALQERFEKVKKESERLVDVAQIIGVQAVIDSQPTAYDVDKTICRLEERKKYLEEEYAFAEACTRIDEIDTILKIVRSGCSGEVKGGVAK